MAGGGVAVASGSVNVATAPAAPHGSLRHPTASLSIRYIGKPVFDAQAREGSSPLLLADASPNPLLLPRRAPPPPPPCSARRFAASSSPRRSPRTSRASSARGATSCSGTRPQRPSTRRRSRRRV